MKARLPVAAPYDLQLHPLPRSAAPGPLLQFACVGGIGPQLPQPRILVAQTFHQPPRSVSVLYVRCVHAHARKQALRVYQQMPLAAVDLFACIVAPRPPFSVVLTD